MTSNNHPATKGLVGKGKISVRFRNINIMLFVVVFCIMATVMSAAFNNVIKETSSDYIKRYAVSTAEVLSGHFVKLIGLLAKTARANTVRAWLADEDSMDKKVLAIEEMCEIIEELYSPNLYIGMEKSRQEYKIEKNYAAERIKPFTRLDPANPDDAWFFECLASNHDYGLNIGIDQVLQRKQIWLNYKVVQNGVPLGVLATGLEFSQLARELFSQYGAQKMRGLIIDKNGLVKFDSALMNKEEFLYIEHEISIEKEFPDPISLAAIKSHLEGIEGYFAVMSEPLVVKLPSGQFLTIAPIRFTNWSIIILYDPSSLLNMSLFMPVSVIMLILLIAFALATNAVSYRLIFLPLGKLERSLARLKENNEERIYGAERQDELGNLAHTIQDLFTKANRDALTGLYNRRFMENNLQKIMDFLSRSNGLLSVLMLDVDHFKKYNDTYGHEQGDICLKAVAQALADSITRANDFTARYGGEEFVAVLPNTGEAGARQLAEKLLGAVQQLNLPHAASLTVPYVTVSIGVTTGQVAYRQNWEDYLKRADEGLYMSKQNGRNQYTYLDFIEQSK